MQQGHAHVGVAPAIHQDQLAGDEGDHALPERAPCRNYADGESGIARHPEARDRVHGRHDRAEAEKPHDRMVEIEFAGAVQLRQAQQHRRGNDGATEGDFPDGDAVGEMAHEDPARAGTDGHKRIRKGQVAARPAELRRERSEEHGHVDDGAESHRDHDGAGAHHGPGAKSLAGLGAWQRWIAHGALLVAGTKWLQPRPAGGSAVNSDHFGTRAHRDLRERMAGGRAVGLRSQPRAPRVLALSGVLVFGCFQSAAFCILFVFGQSYSTSRARWSTSSGDATNASRYSAIIATISSPPLHSSVCWTKCASAPDICGSRTAVVRARRPAMTDGPPSRHGRVNLLGPVWNIRETLCGWCGPERKAQPLKKDSSMITALPPGRADRCSQL